VVFRGFLPSTNHVQIITDRRSQKVTQMAHQARGEICWYFPKTREQFRLAGNLLVVDAETAEPKLQAARTQMWQSISDVARSQFAGPPPDHPCDPMLPISDDAPEAISPLSPLLPLPTFCLVLLMPDRVDHLQLKGNPQLRHRYTSDRSHDQSQSWTMHSINP
jgi:PPOX class probable FMN-dependent enzyme